MKLFKLFVFSAHMFCLSQAMGQTTEYKWFHSRNTGRTHCGEYAPGDLYIQEDQSGAKCRASSPTTPKWFHSRNTGRTHCGEYSPGDLYVQELDGNECRRVDPTTPKWFHSRNTGRTHCGEYSTGDLYVQELDADICRQGKMPSVAGAVSAAKIITIEEINSLIQPPDDSMIYVEGEIAVPGRSGCGAPKDSAGNVQCYICQTKPSNNSMLYTVEGFLVVRGVQLTENKQEVRIGLGGSDDFGGIRCLSKNKSAISSINSLQDLIKTLEDSGIRYKDPGVLPKKVKTEVPFSEDVVLEP